MSASRQLVAILFTDIAGYTAMMQENEAAALAVVRHYTSVLKEVVPKYQGTMVNDYGDGNLCSFTSATEALRCAIELQGKLQSEPKVPLRVGLHIGEIFFEDGKVFGDGVNVASRIQSLGVANSILFSSEVHSKINNQSEFKAVSLGSFHFKNVSVPMEVFALSNEGLVVPARGDMEGKVIRKVTWYRKWMMAAVLALVGVAASVLYLTLYGPYPLSKEKKSVAVLVFKDLSPSKDQGWFSEGMSVEIINSLSNLKELKVTPSTSSFFFRDKSKSIEEIAKTLGVDYLVDGSVRREMDSFRISVQLIDVKDNAHAFSRSYDKPAKEAIGVQIEISERIAETLLEQLNIGQVAQLGMDKPSNVEAYDYYLQGVQAHRDLLAGKGEVLFERAVWLFKHAISEDPGYLAAYFALADIYDDKRGNEERYWRLRDSLGLIAYRIDPNSLYSLMIRALTFLKRQSPNLDSSFFYLRRAQEKYPNHARLKGMIGISYILIGMPEEGKKKLEEGIELDPLHFPVRRILALYDFHLGAFERAEEGLKKITELNPAAMDYGNLALLYTRMHSFEEATQVISRLKKMDTALYRQRMAAFLAAQGKQSEALKLARVPSVWSLLGMKSELLGFLEENAGKPIVNLNNVNANIIFSLIGLDKSPFWDSIRNEPEFNRIRERVKKDYEEKRRKYGGL